MRGSGSCVISLHRILILHLQEYLAKNAASLVRSALRQATSPNPNGLPSLTHLFYINLIIVKTSSKPKNSFYTCASLATRKRILVIANFEKLKQSICTQIATLSFKRHLVITNSITPARLIANNF